MSRRCRAKQRPVALVGRGMFEGSGRKCVHGTWPQSQAELGSNPASLLEDLKQSHFTAGNQSRRRQN